MNTILSSGHAYAIVYQVCYFVSGVIILSGLLAIFEHHAHRVLGPIGRILAKLT